MTNEINTVNCSCSCKQNPCTCGCAVPFYNQVPAVQEDHTKVINSTVYATAISTGPSFNMPACSGSISIILPGVSAVQVGSYLWSAVYGYLKILSFDSISGRAVLENECQPGNASPGTQIPACSKFTITDPPFFDTSPCGGDGVFVTADFVAPILNGTVFVAVTSLTGLLVNSYVQIASGTYLITSIADATTIVVKNMGAGAIPGTVVHAKDALGNCIAPVTLYGTSPCVNEVQDTGALVICANGIATTLHASSEGQVPVSIAPGSDLVEFRRLSLPVEICTYLDGCCFNLIAGTVTYTIPVHDSSVFTSYVGQLIVIHYPGLEDKRWKLDNIPDPTSITITSVGDQLLNLVVPLDTQICVASCCDQLQYQLDNFGPGKICHQDWTGAFAANAEATIGVAVPAPDLFPAQVYTSTTWYKLIMNRTCNDMHVIVHVDYTFDGLFHVAVGDWWQTIFKPGFTYQQSTIGDPLVPLAPISVRDITRDQSFGHNSGAVPYVHSFAYCENFHYCKVIVIPAGKQINVATNLVLSYVSYTEGVIGPITNKALTIRLVEADTNELSVAVQMAANP